MNPRAMPIELTPLEGEDRRRVVEGLKKCIEAYPELREYGIESARKEAFRKGIAVVIHQCGRKLGRPLTDREWETLAARYEGEGTDAFLDLLFDGTDRCPTPSTNSLGNTVPRPTCGGAIHASMPVLSA